MALVMMIAPTVFKQAVYAGTPLENFNVGYDDATNDCQNNGVTWCHNHEVSEAFNTHSSEYQNGYIKYVDSYGGYNDPYHDLVQHDTNSNPTIVHVQDTVNKANSDNGNTNTWFHKEQQQDNTAQTTRQNVINNAKSTCLFNCVIENTPVATSQNENGGPTN